MYLLNDSHILQDYNKIVTHLYFIHSVYPFAPFLTFTVINFQAIK